MTPTVRSIADEHVERSALLDPLSATGRGIVGHDAEMTDLSPAGVEARAEHHRSTVAALRAVAVDGERDRVARDVLLERLGVSIEQDEAGEQYRPLNILGSPVQRVRQVFDLMAKETDEDWAVLGERLGKVPAGLDGFRETLRAGMDRGLVSARRQALACADQADTWAAPGSFFDGLVADRPSLVGAAADARAAYGSLAAFLRDEYAPAAAVEDGVGRERYGPWVRAFNGIELDVDETYRWGWDELQRIEAEMASVAERILPGGGLAAAIEHLEAEGSPAIEGEDAFRAWLQDLMDRTVDELDGVHFDIPARVRRVEAMIAPPGGAAAMYYTGPSEDFSRPGRTWYPTQGRTRFPLWGEVSIAYHEGVPGHHLQVGQVRHLADELTRFQRAVFVSGHGEGWALYAERLMDELGYLDDPAHRLGYLRAQAFRAARVVVDIGLHVGLRSPDTGSPWTPETADTFLLAHSWFPPEFVASEVIRYLGLPGQAISYKVGERVWLDARAEVQARSGAAFDLKAFHARALDLGPMGLDQLRRELVAGA